LRGGARVERVERVENTPIEEALGAIRPIVPAENDQYLKAYGLGLLMMPEVLHAQGLTAELKDTVTLTLTLTFTLTRDGKSFERTFDAPSMMRFPQRYGHVQPGGRWSNVRAPDSEPLYLRNLHKLYEFEHLPQHKTVYVRQSQIQDDPSEPIPDFYARVFEFIENNDVDHLVLDLRLNGGGNNYKNKPIVTGIVRCAKIDRPGQQFVIIGVRTFSACQNLVNELDTDTNADIRHSRRRVLIMHCRHGTEVPALEWATKTRRRRFQLSLGGPR